MRPFASPRGLRWQVAQPSAKSFSGDLPASRFCAEASGAVSTAAKVPRITRGAMISRPGRMSDLNVVPSPVPRSRRQQLIELRRSIGLALLIGDDDPPAFARPNLRLRHDEQPALAGKTALLIIAFCDHFIGQCASPCVALHPFSSWQRALAAIRRERGNLVPSTAALCAGAGSSRTTPAAARSNDPRYPVCIEVYSIAGSAIDCALRSVDADHVWAAEIDQPLHGRQTIVQGGNGE